MRRQSRCQSVDSSSDEYELTDSEIEYHSGSETEPTDVDDDVDEGQPRIQVPVRAAGTLPRPTPLTRARATRSGRPAGHEVNQAVRIDLARLQDDATLGSQVIY
jgi:hypothetical protein